MKHMWMLHALVFILLVPRGKALKCHYCASSISWLDCSSRESEVTCASQLDSCYHGLIREDNFTTYLKGCDNSVQCDSHCSAALSPEECQVSCCTGELCNNATAPSSGPAPTDKPFSCYSCVSSESWAECADNQVEMTCPAAPAKCVEIYMERNNGVKFYMKGCGTEETSCNHFVHKPEEVKQCNITFCDNKNCVPEPHTSPAPTVGLLRCKDCHSNGSWAECKKRTACSVGFASCRKAYNKMNDKKFTKGCYSEEECRRIQEDCKKNGETSVCDMHCCKHYVCHVAEATRLHSGFVISACAVFLMSFAV